MDIEKLVHKGGNSVEHPEHYNSGGIECIEAMRILFSDAEIMSFCKLNAFKYLWRAGLKDDADEDVKKARWYMNYLNNTLLKSEEEEEK